MVILPIGFTPTKYPGYYWNVNKQALYSLKVGGQLRKMKRVSGEWEFGHGQWRRVPQNQRFPHYNISHNGVRCQLYVSELKQLQIVDQIMPIQENGT